MVTRRTTSDDVLTWPATQLAEAVRQRKVSSRELLAVVLDRVDRINPKLNAVVTLDVERARSEAAAADEATARGESTGPLHGLPSGVRRGYDGAGSAGGVTIGAPPFSPNQTTEPAPVRSRPERRLSPA